MKVADNENSAKEFEILDHRQRSADAADFERKLAQKIIGQEPAVTALADIYQIYRGGLAAPGRPVGTMLFLGPTGTGKTKAVEAAAEVIFGKADVVLKIDCAEFQHSHEIAKLKGSPPGYLGHKETSPMLTQENLDRGHSERDKLTLILFDEIEKASDALWHLLLGILDKASLTLGDNRRVDFSRTLVVMTSNLGAREMQALMDKRMGFAPSTQKSAPTEEKMSKLALEAARKRFSPEFLNRIDKTVVFQTLSEQSVKAILEIELSAVQERIRLTATGGAFSLSPTQAAKQFVFGQGIDRRLNARPLKRAIERLIVLPLASLLACGQVQAGDTIVVDINCAGDGLVFKRRKPAVISSEAACSKDCQLLDELIAALCSDKN